MLAPFFRELWPLNFAKIDVFFNIFQTKNIFSRHVMQKLLEMKRYIKEQKRFSKIPFCSRVIPLFQDFYHLFCLHDISVTVQDRKSHFFSQCRNFNVLLHMLYTKCSIWSQKSARCGLNVRWGEGRGLNLTIKNRCFFCITYKLKIF